MAIAHTNAAIGIPDRSDFGDTSQLTAGQLYDYVVQRHQAARAGLHHDLRIGDPQIGLLSWALRKGLPAPREKRLAVMQPVHAHGYKDFKGEIREGYGKGTVERQDLGQVLVTKLTPNAIHFSTAHRRFPERYVLVRPKDNGKNWLMLNTTKTEATPYEKIHYKMVEPAQAEKVLDNLQPGSSTQAKVDGAAALVQLYKDHFDVLSYRTQKEKGYPIVHTERIFGQRPTLDVPKEYQGRTLRGELYGEREGKPIPPHELGGLLNSSISKSLADQEAKKVKLKVMLFDMLNKQQQHQLEVPYEQRMAETKQVGSVLPQDRFNYPTEAKTPEEAKALLGRVQAGTEPSTVEGVVVHPPTGNPTKIKLRDEHDVYLREFFPGQGKYLDRGVGGFRYSHEPEGPIVGEVGTGFSDEERMNMHKSPNDYIGRIARVSAQDKKPSGALFAPSYVSLHEDYNTKLAEAILDQDSSVIGSLKARRTRNRYNLNNYVKEAAGALKGLLKAKERSDKGDYRAKTHEMRELLRTKPHEFEVDSDQGHTVGLTHKPTKFKIHLPKTALPTEFVAKPKA